MSVQCTGVCSTPRDNQYTGDIMSTVGDIMSTVGVFSTPGDILNTPGDIMINVGMVIRKTIELIWKPQCTEHPPVYS